MSDVILRDVNGKNMVSSFTSREAIIVVDRNLQIKIYDKDCQAVKETYIDCCSQSQQTTFRLFDGNEILVRLEKDRMTVQRLVYQNNNLIRREYLDGVFKDAEKEKVGNIYIYQEKKNNK